MSAYALRPSAAGTWVHCPGSVQLCAPFPEDDGPEALAGTAAHWLATELVRTGAYVAAVGDLAPNGVTITDDMVEGAALFQAAVLQRVPFPIIESPVHCPDIHPENGGTPDVYGVGHDQWVWHVVDYKYGHRFVEVFENWQLIDYLSGIFSQAVADGLVAPTAEQHIAVEFTVVQPRSYHVDGPVRSWRVRMDRLRPLVNILSSAAHEAMGPNPRTLVNEGCRDCAARHACTTLQGVGYAAADMAGTAVPLELNAHQTGQELKWLHQAQKALAARIDGLEVQALAMIRNGKGVPHYMAQQTSGNLRWKDGMSAQVFALGELFGKELAKPREPITPTQAKALGIDEAVISEYTYRPRGEVKLAPQDTTTTRKIFGDQNV